MGDFNGFVSLDEAFDCYEYSKRDYSKTPTHYYCFEKMAFRKINFEMKTPGVVFINTYETCLQVIDEYLKQPGMEKYREDFEKAPKKTHNRIINFLFYFDHLDGLCSFDRFELTMVAKILKKWCKSNGLQYLEPETYRPELIE